MESDSLVYFATLSKSTPSLSISKADSIFPSCLPFIRPSSYIPYPKLHMTAKSPSPSCVKSIPKSLCKVVIFSLAFFDESFIELGTDGIGLRRLARKAESFIELGTDGPPVAVRKPPRIQMPLSGNRFKLNTLPRVILDLWQWPWLVARGS
jgi:hypothetical protein